MLHRSTKSRSGSTATIERAGPPAAAAQGTDQDPVTAVVVVAPATSADGPQVLATAVAAPLPGHRHWWSVVATVVTGAGHRVAAMSVIHLPAHHHVQRRSYPGRCSYLDNACLVREMRHL